MDSSAQLSALLELAEQCGLEVRPAPASAEGWEHAGGALVRLRGRELLFLDSSASLADQVNAAAAALAGRREMEDRFIPPAIRQIIEQSRDH